MEQESRFCPRCGTKILHGEAICTNCGQSLEARDADQSYPPAAQERPGLAEPAYSNVQPIWQLLLLWVFTFGLYLFYWFYRNWRDMKNHKNLDISPGWRTAGLAVGFLNLWLMYDQFGMIRDAARQAGVRKLFRRDVVMIAFLALMILLKLPRLPQVPDWVMLFGMLSVVPFALVQRTLNEYWMIEQPDDLPRRRLTRAGKVALAVSTIFTSLVVYGLFLPDESCESLQMTHQAWVRCSTHDGQACVYFPGKPEEETSQEQTAAGSTPVTDYTWQHDSGFPLYQFSYSILPKSKDGDTFIYDLESAASSLAERNEIIQKSVCNSDKYQGVDIVVSKKMLGFPVVVRYRIYTVSNRIWLLQVITRKDHPDPNTERFLKSFKILR